MNGILYKLRKELLKCVIRKETDQAINIISQILEMGPDAINEVIKSIPLGVPLVIFIALFNNERVLQTLINERVNLDYIVELKDIQNMFAKMKKATPEYFEYFIDYRYINVLDIAIIHQQSSDFIERLIESNPNLISGTTLAALEQHPDSNLIEAKIFEKTDINSNIAVKDALKFHKYDLARLLINKGHPFKIHRFDLSPEYLIDKHDNSDIGKNFVDRMILSLELGYLPIDEHYYFMQDTLIYLNKEGLTELPRLYDWFTANIEQIGGIETVLRYFIDFIDGEGHGWDDLYLLRQLHEEGFEFLDSHFKFIYSFLPHEYDLETEFNPLNEIFLYNDSLTINITQRAVISFFVLIGFDPAKIESNTPGKSIEDMNLSFFSNNYYLYLMDLTDNVEYIMNLIYMRPDILLPKLGEKFCQLIMHLDDINIQNKDGNTLMHLALHFKRADIASAISKKLVKIDIKNKAGESPQNLLDALIRNKNADSKLVEQFIDIFIKNSYKINQVTNNIFLLIHKLAWAKAAELAKSSHGTFKVISEKITPKIIKFESSFEKINQHNLLGLIGQFIGLDKLTNFNEKPSFSDSSNSNSIITHDVAHDGNCFFHVLAANTGLTHGEIRSGAVNYIRQHMNEFEGFTQLNINYYINNMNIHGTWADHLIIQAVANQFQWSIEILNADHTLRTMITPVSGEATQNIIAIYTGDNHYHAGYRIASPEEEKIAKIYDVIKTKNVDESSEPQSGDKRKHEDIADNPDMNKKNKNSEENIEEENDYEVPALLPNEPELLLENPVNNSANSHEETTFFLGDILLNFDGYSTFPHDI